MIKECGRCGGAMRVYDSNKTRVKLKCDKCLKTVKRPRPQVNRMF